MRPTWTPAGGITNYPPGRRIGLIISALLLVASVVSFCVLVALNAPSHEQSRTYDTEESSHPALSALVLFVMLPLGLTFTSVLGRDAYNHRRRAQGRYTPVEREALERAAQWQVDSQRSWAAARTLLGHLSTGQPMPELTFWGPLLQPDERAYLHLNAHYARHYGVGADYVHTTGFFLGSAPFVAFGYAMTALGNHSRRQAALVASVPRWREFAPASVIVTDRRLLCEVHGRWLSFYPSGAAAIYPDPADWSVVLAFDDTEPLRFSGLTGPALAVAVVWLAYGQRGLVEHPGLARLR
ncbi:hypothetical protein [Frankia sp. AgB32]|uniref:hypothetical protein n=1 Tax=Frankia sp. AgB32 TaxID=631119 RepID=UPI00200BCB8E|nr:hypothetical protein [Frankia sp. AgB32]MCK9897180.1 hypothetical protein [Frankia sp. AgB32]